MEVSHCIAVAPCFPLFFCLLRGCCGKKKKLGVLIGLSLYLFGDSIRACPEQLLSAVQPFHPTHPASSSPPHDQNRNLSRLAPSSQPEKRFPHPKTGNQKSPSLKGEKEATIKWTGRKIWPPKGMHERGPAQKVGHGPGKSMTPPPTHPTFIESHSCATTVSHQYYRGYTCSSKNKVAFSLVR